MFDWFKPSDSQKHSKIVLKKHENLQKLEIFRLFNSSIVKVKHIFQSKKCLYPFTKLTGQRTQLLLNGLRVLIF